MIGFARLPGTWGRLTRLSNPTLPLMRTLLLAAVAAFLLILSPVASAQSPSADVEFVSDTHDINVETGSYYRVRFTVTNTGDVDLRGGVFVVFDVPGGGQVVRRVENKVLAPGQSETYRFKEMFRPGSPLGDYTVHVSFEEQDRSHTWDAETTNVTVSAP